MSKWTFNTIVGQKYENMAYEVTHSLKLELYCMQNGKRRMMSFHYNSYAFDSSPFIHFGQKTDLKKHVKKFCLSQWVFENYLNACLSI